MRVYKIENGSTYLEDIENSVGGLQEAVGGYLEAIYLPNDVVLLVDEEGKLKGKKPTAVMVAKDGRVIDVLCGTIVCVKRDVEDFTDFEYTDVLTIGRHLEILEEV